MGYDRRDPMTLLLPRAPSGWRAYAVGDVHGRLDLLDRLLGKIDADLAERPADRVALVMLGDLIDRGPDSRGVVERLRTMDESRYRRICLMGNHEEVLLRILAGERGLVQDWLLFGGAECLGSYGVDASLVGRLPERQALEIIRRAIPDAHSAFIESFADTLRFGDYLFVHAGIRPGVAIEEQKQIDLRWIRREFLDHDENLEAMVVHGHTISASVEQLSHRIGIDTGAYRSGVLTALAVEDDRRWFLSTGQ
ncbi:metallophosphoesterase [Sphingomonas jaspsi]|uniref:metallophosphoesterase n=1 Tax=Sphingomonas jaspsi TaxID=392409 RepID=UPI0004BC3939|nr:metallophosphoesterase [Sphingomonas jaspsi]